MRFEGCSHGAIATVIYLMGCIGVSLIVTILPSEHIEIRTTHLLR